MESNVQKRPDYSRFGGVGEDERRKRSVLALIAAVLGVAYAVYIINHFSGAIFGSTGATQAGAAIATALVGPHIGAAVVAAVFGVLGWALNMRGFVLVAGILYAVALALFPLYFMFVIVQMILSFIAFALMRRPVEDE